MGNRLTINAGVRFDHNRAISQDLPAVDLRGTRDRRRSFRARHDVHLESVVASLGVAAKLSADGRTMLRASYGRFSQGVLTGELEPFHPGGDHDDDAGFDPATGAYSTIVSIVNPHGSADQSRRCRAPHTDDYSIGVDREIGRQSRVAIARMFARMAADFIGWTDIGGQYAETTAPAEGRPDGARVQARQQTVPIAAIC